MSYGIAINCCDSKNVFQGDDYLLNRSNTVIDFEEGEREANFPVFAIQDSIWEDDAEVLMLTLLLPGDQETSVISRDRGNAMVNILDDDGKLSNTVAIVDT